MEENGLFHFILLGNSLLLKEIRAGTQGRSLEAGTETEALKECILLTFSPWIAQPAFSYHSVALPKVALAIPHQSLVEKIPPTLAYILIFWNQFLNSLFSSLYQVEKKA